MPDSAVRHSSGTYRYLPAIDPYSSGVAAEPGYEIVGWRFDTPTPVADAFVRLDQELAAENLPAGALAGLALRSPEAFSFNGFNEFNVLYRRLLTERQLLEDDVNPLARTNVVPVADGPAEPVVLAAYIVRKSSDGGGRDYVVAGSGEVDGPLDPECIVARGDLSAEGLARKVAYVVGEMRSRLAALGHQPATPSLVNVYTAHEIPGLARQLSEGLPAVHQAGYVHWLTRPPLVEVEFEMDLNRLSGWRVLSAGA
ncbi:hypothetical protein QQG74_13630 [Micromonospora sp. FIMYZ51]|uniref:2-amino-5-chloromuconate deaminase CnbZ n=1 Tax=Micromonospora sp. FIMYZ51 TaxID=3051832 RepID=UPI0031201F31